MLQGLVIPSLAAICMPCKAFFNIWNLGYIFKLLD